jgi:outer membrane receptor protein involved in Fe transport
MTLSRLLSTTAMTAAALLGAPVLAQNAGLEEIVVTARKTSERLQEVPISITALTSKDLEERGTTDIFKVSQFTPGFSFEKINRYGAQGGAGRPVIRGMSNILGDGNAAVFVDGVLFSDSILSFPFDIVDRVEVIKGPQSALFGRSTFSGAINLITKRGSNKFENEVSATVAEYNNYEINGLSRGPLITDKLFYMVQGRYYHLGAQYKNTIDGKGVGQEESYGANGSLEFRASDALTATVNFGYNEDHDGMAAVVNQDRFSNNCFFNAPRQYYCGQVKRFEAVTLDRAGLKGNEGLNRKSTRLSGQIEYDAENFVITSNTGAFWTRNSYGYDSTYQGVSALAPLTIPGLTGISRNPADPARTGSTLRNEITERDEWSTELRVRSADANRFRFMGGAFYYQKRRPFEERHFPGVSGTTVATTYFGTDKVDNWAVFGSATADLTDKWSASAELRYAQDKIGNLNPLGRAATPLIERTFKSWAPRFTTNYKLDEQSMVYATVAKGNKPGFFNSDPRLPVNLQFASEESSWNYEIGTKNTLLGGKLIANLSAYYIDWKNQQLTDSIPIAGTTVSYVRNAGKTTVKGLEFELNAVFTDWLSGGFTYALADAKFKEFLDAEALQLFGNASVAGKQLPNQPKHQATLFGKVTVPLAGELSGFLRADVAYNERKYDQIYNLAYNGDQYLANIRMGVEADKWTVTFFIDNLFDDRTPSTVIRYVDQLNIPAPATGTVAGTATLRGFQYPLADKRRFGVTGKYKF